MQLMTALVLSASRQGAEDAVAQLQQASHKCLVEIDGVVMLERVVRELHASAHIGRIVVSIESEDLLRQTPALAKRFEAGEIEFVQSQSNLFQSILYASETIEAPYPLLVSTGDNALHTTEMIDHFCEEIRSTDYDAAVAMTPADVILKAYPDGKRAFHDLRDGGWSSCNLYGAMNGKAIEAARAFETGGQFGKKPERILKAFGLRFLIKYKFMLATLDGLAQHLSKRWNMKIAPVRMPFADAPIDVDNVKDFHRTEKILRARRGASETG